MIARICRHKLESVHDIAVLSIPCPVFEHTTSLSRQSYFETSDFITIGSETADIRDWKMPIRVNKFRARPTLACSLQGYLANEAEGLSCHFGRIDGGRGEMKILTILALSTVFVFALPSAYAQVDPFGATDSIIVSSMTVNPASAFAISIMMVNDESIAAFAIPLHYSNEYLVFDSSSFASSLAHNWSYRTATHDAATGSLLVGALAIGDPAIPAGRGKLVDLYFHVKPNVSANVTTSIDSAFVPPAGRFELNTPDATIIKPYFSAGKITISSANQAPVFNPVAALTINEGDSLSLAIKATDPEGAALKLSASQLCSGAKFVDSGNGNARVTWKVPYTGPGSFNGSPYTFAITASDGSLSTNLQIPIEVINVNRMPQVTIGDGPSIGSGDTLLVPFSASDPDFESVAFSAVGLPAGAELVASNPGYLIWGSDISDSGSYTIELHATDESGSTVSENINFQLLPTLPIEMSLSSEQAFSGEPITLSIEMHNRVPVSGFDLMISYDKTLLTFISSDKAARTSSWLQYSAIPTTDGRVIVSGRSNPAAPASSAMPNGSGEVATIVFQVSSNLSYAGLYSLIAFNFIDPQATDENVAYDSTAAMISSNQTAYSNGGLLIKKYDGLIGDINMNGVAFEIGDVVYFTNYFVDPFHYPLTGDRLRNSDVNQDGVPGTLADLMMLIQVFNGSGKISTSEAPKLLTYEITPTGSSVEYTLTESTEFAAALITLQMDESNAASLIGHFSEMKVLSYQDGDVFRVLAYDGTGRNRSLEPGALLSVSGDFEILSQDFIDQSGIGIQTKFHRFVPLPTEYSLMQNTPNPFNPETMISFDLPKSSNVKLEVFNMLGQRVTTLVDGELTAGRHTVSFYGESSDGDELPSGVYLYRLRTGEYSSTRKMVLLK